MAELATRQADTGAARKSAKDVEKPGDVGTPHGEALFIFLLYPQARWPNSNLYGGTRTLWTTWNHRRSPCLCIWWPASTFRASCRRPLHLTSCLAGILGACGSFVRPPGGELGFFVRGKPPSSMHA